MDNLTNKEELVEKLQKNLEIMEKKRVNFLFWEIIQ